MTIVRTKTPSGEAIVILPEAEFERLAALAEDASDARDLAASRARLEAGTDEVLSEADLDALRRAATPLAFWRARRGLSVATLAGLGGTGEAILAAMERGEHRGDILLYRRLADALGVEIEDILPDAEAA